MEQIIESCTPTPNPGYDTRATQKLYIIISRHSYATVLDLYICQYKDNSYTR